MLRFEYELAQELGRTHAELARSMSHEEFLYWLALAKLRAEEAERARRRV